MTDPTHNGPWPYRSSQARLALQFKIGQSDAVFQNDPWRRAVRHTLLEREARTHAAGWEQPAEFVYLARAGGQPIIFDMPLFSPMLEYMQGSTLAARLEKVAEGLAKPVAKPNFDISGGFHGLGLIYDQMVPVQGTEAYARYLDLATPEGAYTVVRFRGVEPCVLADEPSPIVLLLSMMSATLLAKLEVK